MAIERLTRQIDQQFAQTHAAALAALQSEHAGSFDAIVWLSAHLMAAEHALVPAVRRHLPNFSSVLDAHHRADRQLHRALRALEQISAGDTLAVTLDENVVRNQVGHCLEEHVAREQSILDVLSASLSADADSELAGRYRELLTHGVTRPHPHAPSHGPFTGMVFRFDRTRDRLLDVLDSRSTPLPRRPSTHLTSGRWGHYVLGSMQDDR
jgi:hypothetical protein